MFFSDFRVRFELLQLHFELLQCHRLCTYTVYELFEHRRTTLLLYVATSLFAPILFVRLCCFAKAAKASQPHHVLLLLDGQSLAPLSIYLLCHHHHNMCCCNNTCQKVLAFVQNHHVL